MLPSKENFPRQPLPPWFLQWIFLSPIQCRTFPPTKGRDQNFLLLLTALNVICILSKFHHTSIVKASVTNSLFFISSKHLRRSHTNPSPTNIGIHVQVKLFLPGSSSQMAFTSHGPPGSMQSTVCGRTEFPLWELMMFALVFKWSKETTSLWTLKLMIYLDSLRLASYKSYLTFCLSYLR